MLSMVDLRNGLETAVWRDLHVVRKHLGAPGDLLVHEGAAVVTATESSGSTLVGATVVVVVAIAPPIAMLFLA